MSPVREIGYPPEWVDSDPIDASAWRVEGFILFGCLLDSGTNLWALVYEGGVRFGRTTDTGMDARQDGAPLPEEAERVERAWQYLLREDNRARITVDAEMRRN